MGKGEQTKERILARAAVLFNQQGFAGSSMADIMAATGLGKGGIYRHFESKEALALQAFDHSVAIVRGRMRARLQGQEHAVARLRAVLDVFRDYSADPPIAGGCPVMNTAIEADDGNPELRRRARAVMEEWRGLIQRTVARGIEQGEVRAGTDGDALATLMIALLEGGIMMTNLYGDPVHLMRAVHHLDDHIARQVAAPATAGTAG